MQNISTYRQIYTYLNFSQQKNKIAKPKSGKGMQNYLNKILILSDYQAQVNHFNE